MLHTIAAGTRDVQQQQVIYLAHARDHGLSYQPGEMEGLDCNARIVKLAALRSKGGESYDRRAHGRIRCTSSCVRQSRQPQAYSIIAISLTARHRLKSSTKHCESACFRAL